ncbi:MAG: hypothetical protein ACRDIL_20465 [Candidatus Limnocylindrales bacterium]
MIRTLTITHRTGHQPGRARIDRAIGQAWQGRSGGLGSCAVNRLDASAFAAHQANPTGASLAVPSVTGTYAVPTMWTKCTARHLGTRST